MSVFLRPSRVVALLAFLAGAALVSPVHAQGVVTAEPGTPVDARPQGLDGVSFEQRLGTTVPGDITFVDETGATVRLGDYFGARPVILALVYYECPMLCTQVLSGLTSGLKVLAFDAGTQFDVVVVSIDPGEGPGLASAKKATYVDRYGRPETAGAWHFLTGRKGEIDRLASTVGFSYSYDEKTDQYAHAAGITVLTPEGRIARYFFGIDFAPRDLRLGIVEAADRTIATPIDSVLLYCFHYDPSTGKYGLMIMNIVRAAGILFVLGMIWFWMVLRRHERRHAFARASELGGSASHKA
jgi:protein SCO1/2